MSIIWTPELGDEDNLDPALVCDWCDERLCDIEAGDTLNALVRVALSHRCEES